MKIGIKVHNLLEHLDWQLMGSHDFTKLDWPVELQLVEGNERMIVENDLELPEFDCRGTVSYKRAANGKLNNYILLSFASLIEKSCSLQSEEVKIIVKRVMKKDRGEFNSIGRISNAERMSIRLLNEAAMKNRFLLDWACNL